MIFTCGHTCGVLVWTFVSLDFIINLTSQILCITFLGTQSDDKDDKQKSKRKKGVGSTKVQQYVLHSCICVVQYVLHSYDFFFNSRMILFFM